MPLSILRKLPFFFLPVGFPVLGIFETAGDAPQDGQGGACFPTAQGNI